MNSIEIMFYEKAKKVGGLLLFSKSDALTFIRECEKRNYQILGIDGFYLKNGKTLPSLENSIDFSSGFQGAKLYEKAFAFIESKDSEIFFEIVSVENSIQN